MRAVFDKVIAVIALDTPPANHSGDALCERIVQQPEAAQADPSVRGIVLTGSNKVFWAGGDPTEAGTPFDRLPVAMNQLSDFYL